VLHDGKTPGNRRSKVFGSFYVANATRRRRRILLCRILFHWEVFMEERARYFDEALSDFVHDVSSGAAIRHLVDLGYSVEQMMRALTYPTPRERVARTAYRYMLESGLLAGALPVTEGEMTALGYRRVRFRPSETKRVRTYLYERVRENGEDQSYLSCPFGSWRQRDGEAGLRAALHFLNSREVEYIAGIPWEGRVMYHRLTARMQEIGEKLMLHPETGCCCFFLKTREIAESDAGGGM